jgi:hypothetical protein
MNLIRYDLSYRTSGDQLVQLKNIDAIDALQILHAQMYRRSNDFVLSETTNRGQERDAIRDAIRPRRESVGCWTLGDDGSSFPPA